MLRTEEQMASRENLCLDKNFGIDGMQKRRILFELRSKVMLNLRMIRNKVPLEIGLIFKIHTAVTTQYLSCISGPIEPYTT